MGCFNTQTPQTPLRPYQVEAVQCIQKEWTEGHSKTLLVLPTGTGKTICFASLLKEQVEQGDRCLVLAHRGELLDQAQDKIKKVTGLDCAVEKAEHSSLGNNERITVGSIQTLMNDSRREQFPRDYYQTIVVDEAHHVLSDSYMKVLNYFDSAKVMGCTATPDRGDMKNLGKYFDSLAYEYSLIEAIHDGYLCPIKALTVPLNIDISNVKVSQGDYQVGDIGDALEPYLYEIADSMIEYCKDRKTIVFLPLIKTSQKFCQILKDKGMNAAEVNGESKDREQILKDFEEDKYQVLCNSMLLTEGYDCPSIDCVVVLRPTKVRSLYSQMIGRGTRLYPTKKDLLILDFLWMISKHELCRPACLIAKKDEISKRATKKQEEKLGEVVDIEEIILEAEKDSVKEREEALAEQLRKQRHKKMRLVDPLQYAYSINSEDLTDYVPTFAWQMMEVTEGQKKTLENFGINSESVSSRGEANILIDRLIARSKANLATPKQIRFLEQRGFLHVGQWTMEEAKKMIARISNNHWMIPFGINPETYNPRG